MELQYYHTSRPVAVWLVSNEKISTHECDRDYSQLSIELCIGRGLELKNPDYSRDKPTDYEEVLKAGRFVLSDVAHHLTQTSTTHHSTTQNLAGRADDHSRGF